MKTLSFVLLAFLPALAHSGPRPFCKVAPNLRFHGDFGPVTSTGAECDAVFAVKDYVVQHVVAGSSGTISVLNLRTETPKAALHNVSFVGLFGPDCDFGNNHKKISVGGHAFEISASGLVSRDILVAEVTAVLMKDGVVACRAKAEFTGFPPAP